MERTRALPKIRDADKESMFGYVYAVSGPGMVEILNILNFNSLTFKIDNVFLSTVMFA